MADKYGPMFTIMLGSHRVLVLSCWEMAKECFTVHDKVFSTRPSTLASRLLGYNNAMFGFAPYGPYWREMRKIVTIELLSNHRLDMLKHIRTLEVKAAIRELFKMVAGKRFFGAGADCGEAEVQSFEKLIRDFSYLFGVFVLSDTIPFLRWLDANGYEKAMKKTAKELDTMMGRLLEEHKQKKLLGGEENGEQDFMDVMLTILEDAGIASFDADTINKSTCLVSILATKLLKILFSFMITLNLSPPFE
ncbi:Cytochrome P450 82A3 [Fagus crenata]